MTVDSGSFSLQRSSARQDDSSDVSKPVYVQKTLEGGVLLMELLFKQPYFCVNVFALDCSNIPQLSKVIRPNVRKLAVCRCLVRVR